MSIKKDLSGHAFDVWIIICIVVSRSGIVDRHGPVRGIFGGQFLSGLG
jgi:hypothetical protein